MIRLPALAFAAVLAAGPAAADQLVTPPVQGHPLPQGVPWLVVGHVWQPVIHLRHAVIDGRRVLVDPATLRIVYVLRP